jgi:hypothetical protein
MARSRSWFDVLSGCGWSPLFGAALRLKSTIPKEQRLASFRFNPTETAALQPTGIPGHDFGAAVALAKASVLVYADPGTIRATARKWGFADDHIRLIGFGSTEPGVFGVSPEKPGTDQALILADDKYVLVAFRGTDQFADWVSNLNFLPISDTN